MNFIIIFLILLANTETISIPHRIRSKTEPATEESESDDGDDEEDADDVKESMKAILDNLQKEMSDAVDSASESIEKSEISSAKEQDANKKTKRKSGDYFCQGKGKIVGNGVDYWVDVVKLYCLTNSNQQANGHQKTGFRGTLFSI